MAVNRLNLAIESLIHAKTEQPASIAASESCGGGCINDARVVTLRDRRRYFVKSNPAPLPGIFEREAEGLEALAASGAIRGPRPIGTGGGAGGIAPFIVMEFIAAGRQKADFFEDFGRRFAQLHQYSTSAKFGFPHDNYLGSTPQPNAWRDDWVDFWRENRLGHQFALARSNGYADTAFNRLADRLLERLAALISEPTEPPCLLHGDLWSGNFMADEAGHPVIIDPAAYYGRREADLAMTRLFGGFPGRFYDAYNEIWPLADGSDDRLEIYKLYHLLNHLNLFGRGYLDSCMAIMRRTA